MNREPQDAPGAREEARARKAKIITAWAAGALALIFALMVLITVLGSDANLSASRINILAAAFSFLQQATNIIFGFMLGAGTSWVVLKLAAARQRAVARKRKGSSAGPSDFMLERSRGHLDPPSIISSVSEAARVELGRNEDRVAKEHAPFHAWYWKVARFLIILAAIVPAAILVRTATVIHEQERFDANIRLGIVILIWAFSALYIWLFSRFLKRRWSPERLSWPQFFVLAATLWGIAAGSAETAPQPGLVQALLIALLGPLALGLRPGAPLRP